jgi:hypothetical protein
MNENESVSELKKIIGIKMGELPFESLKLYYPDIKSITESIVHQIATVQHGLNYLNEEAHLDEEFYRNFAFFLDATFILFTTCVTNSKKNNRSNEGIQNARDCKIDISDCKSTIKNEKAINEVTNEQK